MRKRAAGKPAAPPPKEPARAAIDLASLVHFSDPKAFLKAVMNEPAVEVKQRVDAARALLPFEHHKLVEGGKKGAKDEAAKKAANKFAATPAPLRAVK
ncbi:terminase small subunit [Pseudoduganella sp. SL102]|nr:terminase small subunit [Pseudoduganella sp. SL102]WBS05628.1 terminase small subunit [Pseudoduganella sp. SL102]